MKSFNKTIVSMMLAMLMVALSHHVTHAKQNAPNIPIGGTVTGSQGQTISAPESKAYLPLWTSGYHLVTITNGDSITKTVTLDVTAPQISHVGVNIGDIGSCQNPSDDHVICSVTIPPNWYWDIAVTYEMNATGRWFFNQCIQTNQCVITDVYWYSLWVGYLPGIQYQTATTQIESATLSSSENSPQMVERFIKSHGITTRDAHVSDIICYAVQAEDTWDGLSMFLVNEDGSSWDTEKHFEPSQTIVSPRGNVSHCFWATENAIVNVSLQAQTNGVIVWEYRDQVHVQPIATDSSYLSKPIDENQPVTVYFNIATDADYLDRVNAKLKTIYTLTFTGHNGYPAMSGGETVGQNHTVGGSITVDRVTPCYGYLSLSTATYGTDHDHGYPLELVGNRTQDGSNVSGDSCPKTKSSQTYFSILN